MGRLPHGYGPAEAPYARSACNIQLVAAVAAVHAYSCTSCTCTGAHTAWCTKRGVALHISPAKRPYSTTAPVAAQAGLPCWHLLAS